MLGDRCHLGDGASHPFSPPLAGFTAPIASAEFILGLDGHFSPLGGASECGLAIEALLKHLLYFPQDVVRASSVEYGTEATIAGTGSSTIR